MNDVGNLHETGLVLEKCKKPSLGIFQVSYFDDKTGRFFMLELSIGILAPDNFLEDHLRGSCQGGIDTAKRIPRTCTALISIPTAHVFPPPLCETFTGCDRWIERRFSWTLAGF
jgi:hypothetical protein